MTMGAAESMPARINEDQAKELAGELWNQYIFDSLLDEDGLADKQDVVDAASEALMAFQGESVEIMRVCSRRKKATQKKFKTNEELGKSIFEKANSRRSGPKLEVVRLAHNGQRDDLVALCELSDPSILDEVDPVVDKTALQVAALYHFVGICEYLIEKGCNVNRQNKESKTAAHYAAQSGNWDVVELLVKAGTNPDLKDHLGRFAGDYVESDLSHSGFVKQDTSRFPEMLEILAPREKGNYLYRGVRQGLECDPPSAEVVAVEINKDSFQVSAGASMLNRTSRSLNSNGSAHSPRRSSQTTKVN